MTSGISQQPTSSQHAVIARSAVYWYGNLLVYLQDAEVAENLDKALENLEFEWKFPYDFAVGRNVLVKTSGIGEKKFFRAAIDAVKSDTASVTDLDTGGFHFEVSRRKLYSIRHLKTEELISAREADSYFVYGFHTPDTIIDPKQLKNSFESMKGTRWLIQGTDERHLIEKLIPVVKLVTEDGSSTFEDLVKVSLIANHDSLLPPLVVDSKEEVLVTRQLSRTLAVQLRYLPLSDLHRLEFDIECLVSGGGLSFCEIDTLKVGDFVAAPYDGDFQIVRAYVIARKRTIATVFLVDYGYVDDYKIKRLRKFPKALAHRIPRYGVKVRLPNEMDDYFEAHIIELKKLEPIDSVAFKGIIGQIVEEFDAKTCSRRPLEDTLSDEEQVSPIRSARSENGSNGVNTLGSDDLHNHKDAAVLQEDEEACGDGLPEDLLNYIGFTDERENAESSNTSHVLSYEVHEKVETRPEEPAGGFASQNDHDPQRLEEVVKCGAESLGTEFCEPELEKKNQYDVEAVKTASEDQFKKTVLAGHFGETSVHGQFEETSIDGQHEDSAIDSQLENCQLEETAVDGRVAVNAIGGHPKLPLGENETTGSFPLDEEAVNSQFDETAADFQCVDTTADDQFDDADDQVCASGKLFPEESVAPGLVVQSVEQVEQGLPTADNGYVEILEENSREITHGAPERVSPLPEGSKDSVVQSDQPKQKTNSPVVVREYCEYPKFSFNPKGYLRVTVTHIVCEKFVLVTFEPILNKIEEALKLLVSTPQTARDVHVGQTILVQHEGKLRRASVALISQSEENAIYYVYLIDYPYSIAVTEVMLCPPSLAVLHRALLFTKLIGSQTAKNLQVGHKYSLIVDRVEGSLIHGVILPDRV